LLLNGGDFIILIFFVDCHKFFLAEAINGLVDVEKGVAMMMIHIFYVIVKLLSIVFNRFSHPPPITLNSFTNIANLYSEGVLMSKKFMKFFVTLATIQSLSTAAYAIVNT
jgi:hypothetical protein